ncbi:MAG: pyruvate kinase [Bacteroidales bacterium]|jgi:pyruvate kinase
MQKKHTKIVATISDQRCSQDHIRELFEAGMNVVRLNTAHQNLEGSKKVVDSVRNVSDEIAILIDTKGPEIRTTVARDPVEVNTGDTIEIIGDPDMACIPGRISVTYPGFVNDLSIGNRILIDDGDIELVVEAKSSTALTCRVLNQGFIKSRKSVNVPSVSINLPSINEKDRTYIKFAIDNDVDFIAHSFVRNKEDVLAIHEILKEHNSKIKIIAKIENHEGVDNIEEILNHVYGIMVARGDLGIEIAGEKIPGIQRMLIEACIRRKKPVIIATQMLHTMIEHPRPTRAEISDVANAIYTGTDALMLSGETAYGNYPVEAVSMMTRIALEVESSKESGGMTISSIDNEIAAFLANTAFHASKDLNTNAVVIDTLTGRTGRYMAAFRNRNPVFAACYSVRVMRELALSYGIFPFYMNPKENTDTFKRSVVCHLLDHGELDASDRIIVVGGSFGPRKGASFLEISKVSDLLGRTL